MGSPCITVLTCCFNAAPCLNETIDSIINQSFHDFEYLIIDDGSTDGSAEIIKKYASRDKRIFFIGKENTGLADSLNLGIKLAKGDWIARLDADDIALPRRLEFQLNFIETFTKTVLVGSGCVEIDAAGNFIKSHRYSSNHATLKWRLEHLSSFFPHSSAFFRKKVAQELGGYCSRFTRSQDWDLWLRMASTGLIGCIRQPLVKVRKHVASLSSDQGGRLQQLMGVAATVCHLRRKAELSDPSRGTTEEWLDFLAWLEMRLENEGYFEDTIAWQSLRSQFYADGRTSLCRRLAHFIAHIIRHPPKFSTMRARLLRAEVLRKLAKESKALYYHHPSRLPN
jgi:glycosyltransferase involved in cell wall biosynthesis